jgi:hypothetical protein
MKKRNSKSQANSNESVGLGNHYNFITENFTIPRKSTIQVFILQNKAQVVKSTERYLRFYFI